MEQVLPFSHIEYDRSAVEAGDISNFTAEEYLSWVRHQAGDIPDVVRVEIDPSRPKKPPTNYMPCVAAVASCPETMLPSAHWEDDVLFAFSELRMTMERLSANLATRERKQPVPPMKEELLWRDFFFGSEYLQEVLRIGDNILDDIPLEVRKQALLNQLEYAVVSELEEEHDGQSNDELNEESEVEEDIIDRDDKDETSDPSLKRLKVSNDVETDAEIPPLTFPLGIQPTTSLLLQFDQVLTTRLLHYFDKWLNGDTGHVLFMSSAKWLYSLLVRLEKPLHQDTAAMVRSLYRTICHFRFALSENEMFLDDLAESGRKYTMDEKLAQLNIIIAICGKYFGQHEVI